MKLEKLAESKGLEYSLGPVTMWKATMIVSSIEITIIKPTKDEVENELREIMEKM